MLGVMGKAGKIPYGVCGGKHGDRVRKASCLKGEHTSQSKKKKWQSYNLILRDTLGILSLWNPALVLGRRRDSQNLF